MLSLRRRALLAAFALSVIASCAPPFPATPDAGDDGGAKDRGAGDAGAPDAGNVDGGTDAGRVTEYFKASNAAPDQQFGQAVALSADGDTLAVGAYGEASSAVGIGGDQADRSAPLSGAVYIFTRHGSSWVQQAYVKASNAEAGDSFGISLALSADGHRLAVGARQEGSSGAVYLFTRSGARWSQSAYVKASNADPNDFFGFSLALSADGATLAVGAPWEDSQARGIGGDQHDNSAPNSGAVYVFSRLGETWSQQAYVKASNGDANDSFGFALALNSDGATLAVSAAFEQSNATGVGGDEGDNSATGSGATYIFTGRGTWRQEAYLKASNAEASDLFGAGPPSQPTGALVLSADGNTLAVGAAGEASNATRVGGDQRDNSAPASGAAYVFSRSPTAAWTQRAYVKATNTELGDSFGALAMSANGSTLVVGAPFEDSNARGLDGDQRDNSASASGAVYVYGLQ